MVPVHLITGNKTVFDNFCISWKVISWCLKLEQHIQKEANITKYKLCEREFVCLNFAYLYLGLRNESKKNNAAKYCRLLR